MNEPYDGVFLLCDGCHNDHMHHREHTTQEALKEAVAKKAVAAGWRIEGDRALCPSCAKRSMN